MQAGVRVFPHAKLFKGYHKQRKNMQTSKERICKLVFPQAKHFKVFDKQRSIVLRMRIAVLARTD